MNLLKIILIHFIFFANLAFANENSPISDTIKPNNNLITPLDNTVSSIHTQYRSALWILSYHEACFTKDSDWLSDNISKNSEEWDCKSNIKAVKSKAHIAHQKMKVSYILWKADGLSSLIDERNKIYNKNFACQQHHKLPYWDFLETYHTNFNNWQTSSLGGSTDPIQVTLQEYCEAIEVLQHKFPQEVRKPLGWFESFKRLWNQPNKNTNKIRKEYYREEFFKWIGASSESEYELGILLPYLQNSLDDKNNWLDAIKSLKKDLNKVHTKFTQKYMYLWHGDEYRPHYWKLMKLDNVDFSEHFYLYSKQGAVLTKRKNPKISLSLFGPGKKSVALLAKSYKPRFKKSENSEAEVMKEFIAKIHVDLRTSLLSGDYLTACIKKDDEWFKKSRKDLKLLKGLSKKSLCPNNLLHLRKKIKESFPVMRMLLAAMNLRSLSLDSTSIRASWQDQMLDGTLAEDDFRNVPFYRSFVQERHLTKPPFPGLVSGPDFTLSEALTAQDFILRSRKAKEKYISTGIRPVDHDNQTLCYEKQKIFFSLVPTSDSSTSLACIKERYFRVLLGSGDGQSVGLPILGFIENGEPTDEELIIAIAKIKENTLGLLKSFRKDYMQEVLQPDSSHEGQYIKVYTPSAKHSSAISSYKLFKYVGFLKRNFRKDEARNAVLEKGEAELMRQFGITLGIQIGGIVAWSIACGLVLKNPVPIGLCELPVGLGANAYFLYMDTSYWHEGKNIGLYRADGSAPAYMELSEMSDLQFARNLSLFMLPLFTGVPKLIKAFDKGSEMKKIKKGSELPIKPEFYDQRF